MVKSREHGNGSLVADHILLKNTQNRPLLAPGVCFSSDVSANLLIYVPYA